jgi:hypothetical protein
MLTHSDKRLGGKFVVALLISVAALDITRCTLVLMTYRQLAPAVWFVATGAAMAVLSVAAARGYRAGRRWAVLAALLIGLASAPQASGSGFRAPFTIPRCRNCHPRDGARSGDPRHCGWRHAKPYGRKSVLEVVSGLCRHKAIDACSL